MEEIEAAAQQLRDWIAEREREKAEAIESRDSQTEAATLVPLPNPFPPLWPQLSCQNGKEGLLVVARVLRLKSKSVRLSSEQGLRTSTSH